ncbi:MAG TPA: FKBP-type peptidyl-prolyl cis-trans isomerase [Solirubrobacterales bacterium]
MRGALLTIVACLALALAGCGDDDSSTTAATNDETSAAKPAEPSKEKTKPQVTVPDGAAPKKLVENDIEVGTGATAKAGDEVTVQYVGVGYDSKKEFDSSWSRSEPFAFNLGAGEVIPGWDQGIEGMKVGGRRELVIPPNLAYGPAGSPPVIGQNETLIFVVDLEAVS